MHHVIVLDAIKARKGAYPYLDSSNSDLQAEITLAVDRSHRTMLLFVDNPTRAVVQLTIRRDSPTSIFVASLVRTHPYMTELLPPEDAVEVRLSFLSTCQLTRGEITSGKAA